LALAGCAAVITAIAPPLIRPIDKQNLVARITSSL
jgi:hypothetical protein